jgi:hypothetical protein
VHNVEGMGATLPVLAGMVSTVVSPAASCRCFTKALRTSELSSCSLGNIALANVGDAVHSVYVVHLPPGPIWFLHTLYVVSSALMLYWYLRCRPVRRGRPLAATRAVPMAAVARGSQW